MRATSAATAEVAPRMRMFILRRPAPGLLPWPGGLSQLPFGPVEPRGLRLAEQTSSQDVVLRAHRTLWEFGVVPLERLGGEYPIRPQELLHATQELDLFLQAFGRVQGLRTERGPFARWRRHMPGCFFPQSRVLRLFLEILEREFSARRPCARGPYTRGPNGIPNRLPSTIRRKVAGRAWFADADAARLQRHHAIDPGRSARRLRARPLRTSDHPIVDCVRGPRSGCHRETEHGHALRHGERAEKPDSLGTRHRQRRRQGATGR